MNRNYCIIWCLEASPRGRWQKFAKLRPEKGHVGSNPTASAFTRRSSKGRRRASNGFQRTQSAFVQYMFYYVYLLRCKDGKPYIGCTDYLKERIIRHKKGQVPATKNRLPIKLISYFAFSNKYTAYNFEKYLKSGSGRAFVAKYHLLDNI